MSTPPRDYPGYPGPGYPPLRYGPPTYPPPGYGPPIYGPPTGYPPPGYGPAPGYGPPPGYPPPGYAGSPQPIPGGPKPGIIPLRPLSLSNIFNGAVGYIRANPKATLGLTAIIVVITEATALIAVAGPSSDRQLTTPGDLTAADLPARMVSGAAGGLVGWLGGIMLTGMLAVIVGRAVFGSTITIGEAWSRINRRLLALVGLAALEGIAAVLLIGLVALTVATVAAVGNGAAAFLVGLPLVPALIATVGYLYTVLTFAPALIVLERLPVIDAIARSVALVRNSFWRVLGIRLLTAVVIVLITGAVAAPFRFVGQLMATSPGGTLLMGITVSAIGSTIGRIITAPFGAGVVALLYTDRRIRVEAFDLVLRTGAARGPAATASTDHLWLTQPV